MSKHEDFEYGKASCKTCKWFKLEGECLRCTHPSNIVHGCLHQLYIYREHPATKNIFGRCDNYES